MIEKINIKEACRLCELLLKNNVDTLLAKKVLNVESFIDIDRKQYNSLLLLIMTLKKENFKF